MNNKKTLSLVLGSGGARGYAHIGVIEELVKRGYTIKSISGASMGALIGGLYAAGKLEEFKEWVLALKALDVAKYMDLSFAKSGLIHGDKIFGVLEKMLGDTTIESLSIPYTAVSVDITKQKEVWFQSGSLLDAIRASVAIPTIFTPQKRGESYLVDGGLLNPLPIAPTIPHQSDMTLVISLYGTAKKYDLELSREHKNHEKSLSDAFFEGVEKVNNYLFSKPKESNDKPSMYDVLWNSIDTMQNTIIQFKQAGYQPDHTLYIPKNSCDFYEFNRAYEMIELGRLITREYFDSL